MLKQDRDPAVDRTSRAWAERIEALSRARVFVPAAPALVRQPLDRNPRDPYAFDLDERLACDFVPRNISGTTPKFDCRLPNGDMVKVKYGRTPEVHAEVAATRLLAALGFGADHVSFVRTIDCRGCPPAPFRTRQIAELYFLRGLVDRVMVNDGVRTYRDVAVERRFDAAEIEADGYEGWQWSELQLVKSDLGGASRGELDALRLMAVVLGHWDNKSSNQRLVCLDAPRGASPPVPCPTPLVMLQDLGSTFGPRKLNRDNWAATPVWADAGGCRVSMREMPYDGATFVDVEISEEGRSLLAARLRSLSSSQLDTLFRGAAFPEPADRAPADISAWATAFEHKVAQIANRPPCPQRSTPAVVARSTSP
jgi:hypothetical protein